MNGLSVGAKDDMLAIFAGQMFSLALFSGDQEVTDRMYSRQSVQFSLPVGEGTRYVQNTDVVRFEGFNITHHVDGWGVFDASGLRAQYRLTKALDVSPDMDCKFRPGELRIGLP